MQPTAARRAPKKYRVRSAGDWIPTLRARSEYGLTGRELTELDVRSLGGGVGKGPPAYFYDPEQLWDAAVAKHGGVDAFEKMRAARAKRADMKRARMDETETSAEAQPKKSKGVAEHNTSPVRCSQPSSVA